MIYAPKFPLRKKDNGTFENEGDLKSLIKFHLTNLILTNPGEKISDPEYGVGLRKYLFESFSSGASANIRGAIEEGVETYLPYIELDMVTTEETPEQNKLKINIHYTILDTTEKQLLELALNIGETGTSGPVY